MYTIDPSRRTHEPTFHPLPITLLCTRNRLEIALAAYRPSDPPSIAGQAQALESPHPDLQISAYGVRGRLGQVAPIFPDHQLFTPGVLRSVELDDVDDKFKPGAGVEGDSRNCQLAVSHYVCSI